MGEPAYLQGLKLTNLRKKQKTAPASTSQVMPPSESGRVVVDLAASDTPPLELSSPSHPIASALTPSSGSAASQSTLPAGLRRGALWESGVSSELRAVTRAPPVFSGSGFPTEEQMEDMQRAEDYAYKIASLIKPHMSVLEKLAEVKQHRDSLKADNDKLSETLTDTEVKVGLCLADLKSIADYLGVEPSKDLILSSLKEKAKVLSEEKKKSELLAARNQKLAADLECSQKALLDAVEGAFNNAVSQIRYFNPAVPLNTDEIHFGAYVNEDGDFVAPNFAAAPAEEGEVPPSHVAPSAEIPGDRMEE